MRKVFTWNRETLSGCSGRLNEVAGGPSQTAMGPTLFLYQPLAGSCSVRTVASGAKAIHLPSISPGLVYGTDARKDFMAGSSSKDTCLSGHKMRDRHLCPNFHLC